MIVPNEATGNFEIRDNTGRVTGYVRPNDAIGGYEPDDAAGRSKGSTRLGDRRAFCYPTRRSAAIALNRCRPYGDRYAPAFSAELAGKS
jgi:hypothetical protein